MELWLKSYFSLFFDFKHFGSLTWLTIPLFFYFFITIKKRKRGEIALAFVFSLSFLFLSIWGRDYYRYNFTLYPFTLAAIFLYGWGFIKKKNPLFQVGIFLACGIIAFINYNHFREPYRFFWEYKVSVVDDYFPHELLKFINSAEDITSDELVLVCSQRHLFFYHTDKKGIDFRDPRFSFISGKKSSLEKFKNQLKIKYIYLPSDYDNWILNEIITNDCDLIYQDKKNGLYLYRICEKDLDKENLSRFFVNDSLLRNGSFENWTDGPFRIPDYFEEGDNIFKGMVAMEEKEIRVGKYSARITGDNFNFSQDLSNFEDYKGKNLTCFAWVKTNVLNKYRLQIYDGIDSSFSKRHSGSDNWELLQVNHKVNPSAKFVLIRIIQAEKTGKPDDVVYVDGALLVEGDWNTFYLYRLHTERIH